MFSELDVVNACLATIGETPLVELEDDHPMVAAARQKMRQSNVAVMHRPWWFNTDIVTLQTANDRFVYVPRDAVAVNVIDRADLTQRGRRLYNRFESTYEINGPLRTVVTRDLPYDDLPTPAQLHLLNHTVLAFQTDFDGDATKMQKLGRSVQESYVSLNTEHIRQVRLNGLETLFAMVNKQRTSPTQRLMGHRSGSGIPVR